MTKRLFQEGYDKEHYPDYVKPFNQYYGGFEYTLEAQRNLVFKTPCGLLVKGIHWNSGHMSFMGVDWCLENGNPTLNCPYRNVSCKKRHELLQGITTNGRCMIVHCDCALQTNRDCCMKHLKNSTGIVRFKIIGTMKTSDGNFVTTRSYVQITIVNTVQHCVKICIRMLKAMCFTI